MGRFLIIVILLVWAPVLWALELYEAQVQGRPSFVIVVRAEETPEQAWDRWKQALLADAALADLINRNEIRDLKATGFKKVQNRMLPNRALLVANIGEDMKPRHYRVIDFQKMLEPGGMTTSLLPLGLSLGLTNQEIKDFRSLIANRFSMLVAMGGADVDPKFYGQEIRESINVNSERDKAEIELIRTYVKVGRGFLLGVCRGSQIGAVALGYQMIQDVPTYVGNKVKHQDSAHLIDVLPTSNGILQSVLGEEKGSVKVNSYHHQAVVYKEGGPLEIAAISKDGVVEATELKNGKGLLVQFHPEITPRYSVGESKLFAKNLAERVIALQVQMVQKRCQRMHLQ